VAIECSEIMAEPVDMIIKTRFLIKSFDSQPMENIAIAINRDRIIDVDKVDKILNRYRADIVIDRNHHVLLPGFLDCHTHTQQILLRSSISDYLLQLPPIWVEYLIPFEKRLSKDLAYISSLLSVASMARNGTIYFIEAGAPYPEELIRAINDIGIKGIVTYATYDIYKDEVYDSREILYRFENMIRNYRDMDRIRVWGSIRQIMMISKELLEGVRDICKKYGVGLTMHLDEYQGEVDFTLSRYGLRPLEIVDKMGLTDIKPFVIAHGVYMSEREVSIAESRGIHICWCPTVDSILMGFHWLGIRSNNIKFGIGSDGGAFTSLDLLHEIKIARSLSKALSITLTYDKIGLDSKKLLRALTGYTEEIFNDNVGRIDKGYKADFITIDLKRFSTIPFYDPIETIIAFSEGIDIYDVIVNGEFIVREGRLIRIDEKELIEKIITILPELSELLNEIKKNISIEKTIAI